MLRLFVIKNIPFNNSVLLNRQKRIYYQSKSIFIQTNLLKSILDESKRIKQCECKIEKRFQSTKYSLEALIKKRKKRRLNNLKYVELLQVTQASTKQTKTKVKNLKAETLSNFIQKNGNHNESNETVAESKKKIAKNQNVDNAFEYQMINFEMLENNEMTNKIYDERPLIFVGKDTLKPENVNEILESLDNFKEIFETNENFPLTDFFGQEKSTENDKIHSEECDIIEDEIDVLNKENVEASTKEQVKKNDVPRSKSKYKTQEQERLAKEKSLTLNLTSYIKVCAIIGMINRGFVTVITCREKYKNQPFLGIDIYNILLHGFAGKGNYNKIKEILNILNEDRITLNHQSFAAIFECLGRLEISENNKKDLQKYKEMAKNLGITLNDIMDKSKFYYDQREIVLNAINRIEPNFIPIYTPPSITYDNILLNELNKDIVNVENIENNLEQNCGKKNKMNGYTAEKLRLLANEQLKVELEGSITIKSVEKTKEINNTEQYRKKLDELFNLWRTQIRTGINRDMNTFKAKLRNKPFGLMTYYVYLKTLNIEQYADILLKEIRILAESSETYSPTVNQLYKELGNKVKIRYLVELKKNNGVLNKINDIYTDYCGKLENSNNNDNYRQIWQRIVHSKKADGSNVDIDEISWPNNVSMGVGKFLYNILMRDLKIDVNIMSNKKNSSPYLLPAFYTLFRSHGKTVKEEVKPHPVLARLLRASQQQTLTFDSSLVPMLCPPQPWSTPDNGGYLLTKSELIRLPLQAIQQWERIKNTKPENLYPSLDSLNQLSSIPWKVNTEVLDTILKVFNDGGDNKLGIPQHPNTLPPLPSMDNITDKSTSKVKQIHHFQQKMIQRRKQAEMYSLWCDTLYRLSLANYYRDKVFWLPHNMDFRGRVYPIPPHLNHLGSDMARSMLIFDEARPLGPDGFTWLKLHCVNLTGLKKRDPVRERILFAEEVMDEIIDSADNPLTGRKWWTKSDEPWQTLACCMEIAKVLRSGNPEEYMSNFPVHQDGSCNGLQHYAALGRDKAGAYSVNLASAAIPQDVYSTVANLVEKMRKEDESKDVQIAKILNGFVRRKVIKQTVMTTVYGVTRYGARLQIAKQLKDIDDFPQEWVWRASSYLTTKTFESLREMFTSTKEIQDWFTECARIISNTCNKNVEWITPLGLPIVQPYNNKIVSNKLNSFNKISDKMSLDMYERPNTMKQKNAFPPNFIHSLDSSHMMLTSLFCERQGITFVSVHDCFWTHACTVPDMNKICREQFVALHSQPILEDLSEFLVNKFYFNTEFDNDDSLQTTKKRLNKILKNVPQKGDFNLNNVLQSIYFFS